MSIWPRPKPKPPAPPVLRPIVVWAVPGARVSLEAPAGTFTTVADAQGVASFPAVPDGSEMPSANLFIEDPQQRGTPVPGYEWYGQVIQMPRDAEAHQLFAIVVPEPLAAPLQIQLPVTLKATFTTRRGLVRADGKAVLDDTGYFHPLGLTFFWAYQGWTTERARFKRNIEFLRPYNYDFVRVLCEVGWPGRAIMPSDAGYEQTWGEIIDYLYDVNGLRVELTLIGGDSGHDPFDVAVKMARVVVGREHKVMGWEAANEGHADRATIIRMVQYLRANSAVPLVATTAWGYIDDSDGAQRESGATETTIHIDRSDPDGRGWRQVRQGYDFKSLPGIVNSNEPPGPHSSISSQTDPLILAMMRANGVICGGAKYVLHIGDMVTGLEDQAHGRVPNLWEIANIDQILKVVRGVDAWLPTNVENWTRTSQHGGTDRVGPQPLLADAIWSDGADHGVDRAYAATDGQSFVEVLNGVMKQVSLSPLDNYSAVVVDPVTRQEAPTVLTANAPIVLGGDPDAHMGRIVTGARR